MNEALHREVVTRRLQVLTQGQHVDIVLAHAVHDLDDLLVGLAEAEHQSRLGRHARHALLELLEDAFSDDPKLNEISGYVDDSGEGRWTVEQAIESRVAAPVITQALFARFQSRDENSFSNRVLAALRREFGGHAVKTSSGD